MPVSGTFHNNDFHKLCLLCNICLFHDFNVYFTYLNQTDVVSVKIEIRLVNNALFSVIIRRY